MPPEPAAALRALEEELLEPAVRRSADRVGRLLADEFIEIGSAGHVYDKRQTIDALRPAHPYSCSTLRCGSCRPRLSW